LNPEDYEVLLIVAGPASYTRFGFTIKIEPMAWREFLGGRGAGRHEALSWGEAAQQPARVDERHERGATRGDGMMRVGGTNGWEALAWWEASDNQPYKRQERDASRGSGAMGGKGAGRQEVAEQQEVTQQTAGADKRQAP
jgi:hypothetical protein